MKNLRQLFFNFGNVFFYAQLGLSLSGCDSVLDVACGSNSPIQKINKRFYSEGIDIYGPSIDESKKNKIHDKYILGDIKKIEKYYKNKSFDAVIAIDVVEHLGKKEGLLLLKKLEKIAKKKVIVLTPNGFVHQGHFEGNPYQQHKSGWFKEDLEDRGYEVHGLRSFKSIRGELAMIKFKPWLFWGFIALVTEPILYYFPTLSFDLFAFKKV